MEVTAILLVCYLICMHTCADALDVLLVVNAVQIYSKVCGAFVDSKTLAIVMER